MPETPLEATSTAQPANLDLIPQEMSEYGAMIASLTTIQQRILWGLVQNMSAEIVLTEVQLAEKLGIDPRTIQRARKIPAFQTALAYIIRDNIRGIHDKLVGGIIKHGEKDWNAYKFLLQYDGSYVQKSQSMNLNASISTTTAAGTPSTVIEASCQKYIALGYDLPRYIAEITEVWTRLKAEGM